MADDTAASSDNFDETFAIHLRFPAQHSAQSRVDNCFRDQAVTNARELAGLLTSADTSVVSPSG